MIDRWRDEVFVDRIEKCSASMMSSACRCDRPLFLSSRQQFQTMPPYDVIRALTPSDLNQCLRQVSRWNDMDAYPLTCVWECIECHNSNMGKLGDVSRRVEANDTLGPR